MRVLIDIETRSVLDLKKFGICNYAQHATTAITHVGYSIDNSPIQVWQPPLCEMPPDLRGAVADPTTNFTAHNSGFERLILRGPAGTAIGFPSALGAVERWNCTAARAAILGLPRALEDACVALSLPLQKDKAGHALMLRVCKPRSLTPLTWWDDADRMNRMAQYCRRDVECEAQLDQKLPELTPTERAVWLVTEKMNDRGAAIDMPLLERLLALINEARIDLDRLMKEATAGAVQRVSITTALTAWLRDHGLKEIGGCDKYVVRELLERDDLDPIVEDVLELRRDGGGSSTTKTAAMTRQVDARDGRLRHQLVYAGASSTGRWSSNGVQLQNLPRNTVYDLPPILRDLRDGITAKEIADIYGPTLQVISELLRPLIVAPNGHRLIVADFAQVEARILAWLAAEHPRLEMFRAFDRGGPDPYTVTASQLFNVPIDKVTPAQRQVGKVAELALGFQGGHRALQKMAKLYGLRIPKLQAEEWKETWRANSPAIVSFWHELELAAHLVIGSPPGRIEKVGLIEFARTAQAMTMRLPSKRKIIYWRPSLRERKTPWDELRLQPHCFGRNNYTKQWEDGPLYGGLLCENAVQGTARDLLADALLRLDSAGFYPLLTVHDEIVCQTEATAPAESTVASIMHSVPTWASGLPTAAKVACTLRYMKE